MIGLWRPGRGRGIACGLLLPLAGVFRVTATLRRVWHQCRRHPPLDLPAVIIGNLTVGGTGKTPLAAWFAGALRARGARPTVIVHARAADEGHLIAAQVPAAEVLVARVRRHAARQARGNVLVFDDGLQHPGLDGALRVTLMATEQEALSPWPLPAGPWREGRSRIGRSDLVVVTRKHASAPAAARLAAALAAHGPPVAVCALRLTALRAGSGATLAPDALAGRRVLAVAGLADPEPFRAQLQALGAEVTLRVWPDHHRPTTGDRRRLLEESRGFDYVVVTSKDGEKLQTGWPAAPALLVAELAVHWEAGYEAVSAVLDRLVPERHMLTRNLRQAAAGIS